jgi:hypothetical protein
LSKWISWIKSFISGAVLLSMSTMKLVISFKPGRDSDREILYHQFYLTLFRYACYTY